MTSHYAFSPAYQGLYFDYTKEKTLSTLVNLRMFWRIKINCYRLNTWGVSQMEINIALLEHRRQAWNWKATWILNHFRFPKPFYFKEHDLSKQNFPIPSFSRSLKYIVLFHSKMSLQWGRLKEQRRSCVTQSLMEQRASPPLSLLRVCRSLGHHHRKQTQQRYLCRWRLLYSGSQSMDVKDQDYPEPALHQWPEGWTNASYSPAVEGIGSMCLVSWTISRVSLWDHSSAFSVSVCSRGFLFSHYFPMSFPVVPVTLTIDR